MTVQELLEGVVIPIDKPRQWTSFQAVNKVKAAIRSLYGIKKFKIGHAGTLDPLASGLLLVCVGKATKRIAALQEGSKVYAGTMVLGATTPCYDLEQAIDRYYPWQHVTPELLESARQQFVGRIQQVPPIFSAVKIDGKRAYQLARQGGQPPAATDDRTTEAGRQPSPKEVEIYDFEITAFRQGRGEETEAPVGSPALQPAGSPALQHRPNAAPHLYTAPLGIVPPHLPQLDFRIHCGKGTYIRSIARDMGVALDSGAFLAALRREQVGAYTLQQAVKLQEVEKFLLSPPTQDSNRP